METSPQKIFQQSVTMTAKMWPQSNDTVMDNSLEWGWRVPPHHWPLLVAMFCGGALVLLLVVTTILWHCCVAPHRNKDYSVRMDGETLPRSNVVPVLPSHSTVLVEAKYPEWNYSSRLVTPQQWQYNCGVPRSLSAPPPTPCTVIAGPCTLPLPHISEFSPGVQYVSNSILEEYSLKELYPSVGGVMLKTQSLPACVRSKTRPVSTTDDLAELYAKVNFSKKRKNRMRHDEAAIIALSRSRSQFFHKDTDSLVDNEAVIVYDERTAL